MTQPVDRLHDSIARILASELAQAKSALRALMTWQYQVVAVHNGSPITIDCRFVGGTPISGSAAVSPAMPDLPKVVLRPGPGGTIAVPPNGSTVFVQFVNGQMTIPYVVALDPNATPTLVQVGGGAGAAVGRVGDTIQISVAQWNAASPTSPSGSVTISQPMNGKISSGSGIVTST